MSDRPPIPVPLWQTVPPEAQVAFRVRFETLEQRIADLEYRLGRNSTNSSRPPSSDSPSVNRRSPTLSSGDKRHGQPGHPHHPRVLVTPEEIIP
jgi:transposase